MEQKLIERCRKGDKEAFAPLIDGYKAKLYGYLLRYSGDKEQAEDLFQEALIKAWRGLRSYNERNKFSSWLFSIAHNLATDSYRRTKGKTILPISERETEISTVSNPAKDYEARELTEKVEEALTKLTEKQKEVFLMRHQANLSFKEISELLNQPLNTVLSHMHYAVKKIRNNLIKENVI